MQSEFAKLVKQLRPQIRKFVSGPIEEALHLHFAKQILLCTKLYRGKDLEVMIKATKIKYVVFYRTNPKLCDKIIEIVLDYSRKKEVR